MVGWGETNGRFERGDHSPQPELMMLRINAKEA